MPISNRPLQKDVLLSRPRVLPEPQMEGWCLSLPLCADGGAAPEPATVRRWRGGALPCCRTQEEGRHPTMSSRAVGGGSPDQAVSALEVRRVSGSDHCDSVVMQ
jgi:hypothetical protein